MAENDLDGPIVPHVPIPTRGRPLWVRGMACVAILPLIGFIGLNGKQLWGEFRSLRDDQVSVRATQIVGYIDINPVPSFARSPNGYIHDEGDTTQLWAGWRKGQHHWFTLSKGDVDPTRLSTPMGQDAIRAIDCPLFETTGGKCWVRVPPEALVAGFPQGNGAVAYPLTVLDKVEMVNDQLNDRPVLIVYTPVSHEISIYDASVDGKRVTFGHGGYFYGNQPVLYDRKTESLWTEQKEAMVAFSGTRRGTGLRRIARLDLVPWSVWKAENSGGKLLVGADRSGPIPLD